MSDNLPSQINELMDSVLKRLEFLSQLQKLIQNPPPNPSNALITLNRLIGNPEFSKLFPEKEQTPNPVYKVPIESLNDGKSTSYSPPEFSSDKYINQILTSLHSSKIYGSLVCLTKSGCILPLKKYILRLKERIQETISEPVFRTCGE